MGYTAVHLPVGYKVEIETDAGSGTFTDLGVTMNEGSLAFSYDSVKVTGSRAEGVLNFFKSMTIEAQFTLLQQDLAQIDKLLSGASAYATVAGSLVSGYEQTLVANKWARSKFIPFENQNGNGDINDNVVVSNPAALTEGIDYVIMQDETGLWGVLVLDGQGVLTNNLVLEYDYTPNASKTLTAGSASVDIKPRVLRISKELATGKWWVMTIYAAVNSGGLSFSLPRYDADEPSILEVTMAGQLDTDRSDLDKLFSISDSFGV